MVSSEIGTMDFERYMSLKARIQAVGESNPVIKYQYAEIIEIEGKDGSPSRVIQKSAASQGRGRDSPFGEYAIVARDRVNAKGETEETDLEIQCETMQKALNSVFGDYSPEGFRADPIVFRKPYYSLFHCRREVQDLMTKTSNTQEQKQHLEWLVNFMSEHFQTLDMIQEGLVDKGLITFKDLPIIFEAGSIVLGHSQGLVDFGVKREKSGKTERPECFLFHEISDEMEDKFTVGKYRNVKVFSWGYNGSAFGLTAGTLQIKEFAGPRKITDLECFPLKHLKDEDKNELVPGLIARGKRWCEYVKAKTMEYKGIAKAPTKSNWSFEVKIVPKNMPGRVILDYQAFVDAFPELSISLHNKKRQNSEKSAYVTASVTSSADWKISSQITLPRGDLWRCDDQEGYKWTDAQALLCPALSPGYSLAKKEWAYFDIDLLEAIEWPLNPLKELEMDTKWKYLLKDLIMGHSSKPKCNGVISGKGEGLIFLLYGPPGCGKTLTAELIAEENQRALLPISCGDLGQYPYEIERNLQPLLKLALQVSAIVLIDEADTFLTDRRVAKNYTHSAVVSVFLRYLEYFPGVIFLTTNQETEIDDAISSRAISLPFNPLDATSRTKIWKSHLSKGTSNLKEQAIHLICEELGKNYELDGREVKKLAQLSLDVSRQREEEISIDIIQQMYDLTHSSSCSRAAD